MTASANPCNGHVDATIGPVRCGPGAACLDFASPQPATANATANKIARIAYAVMTTGITA